MTVARPLHILESTTETGHLFMMAASEWARGYLEVHISTPANGQNFIIWDSGMRIKVESDTQMRLMALEIFKLHLGSEHPETVSVSQQLEQQLHFF